MPPSAFRDRQTEGWFAASSRNRLEDPQAFSMPFPSRPAWFPCRSSSVAILRACREPSGPLARASSHFSRPFFKYSLSGTSVSPFSVVRPIRRLISERFSSSFRVRNGIMVGIVAMGVGTDVTVEQPHFTGLDDAIRIFQIHSTITRRLDFGSGQHHTRFELFKDVVVVKRLPVDRNSLAHFWFWIEHRRRRISKNVIV